MNGDLHKTPPVRVFIQQNLIAHYRTRIFELLTRCSDIEFTILADSKSDTPFLKTFDGSEGRSIRHIQCDTKFIRIPGFPALTLQPKALDILRRERPDAAIVMGSPYSLTAWVAGIMGRLLGIPVIMWGHGLLNQESGPKWWIRRTLYRLASAQLLYGNHARKLLVANGFDASTLHVVYNSLDYDVQMEIANRIRASERSAWKQGLGVEPGTGVVIFTGRLQPVKRLDLLILAAARLAKRGRIVHVALIGDGSEKSKLKKLAMDCGIGNLVHFLGERYDEDYLALALSSCDLSVVPSGAGLSVMHAMTYGTPVLIHDRLNFHFPEWEAVKEGTTGFYYRYEDIDDMADKIEQAIFPEPAKIGMSEKCQRIIRDYYNPHRQVEIISAAVRSVIRDKEQ